MRWVDQEWPGLMEVRLNESNGAAITIIDKVPVFDSHNSLRPGVEFPVELEVPCDILGRSVDEQGRRSVLVRLHFDIEAQDGRQDFRVDESNIMSREP